jgi:putative membrane-bound dehydrogenase-like protein
MTSSIPWLAAALAFVAAAPARTCDEGTRLTVLFLGDRGHHRPAERAQDALAPLRERGIDLVYEEDLDVLDPPRLAGFDAVLLYANHASITPAQERALIDWVEAGGAFVPVHCASYCFLDSPRFVELVGAQFQSHGTGVFTTERVSDHPAIADLLPLESWDETYVHHRHAADRTVLATRAGEPWTWVRTQGAGRVFYTAWGHDERTWGQPAFHDLLERGIRWAVGDAALAAPRPTSPFTTIAAPDRIPNYQPGRPGAPFERMPAPLDAAASLRRMVVPPGLRVELFAAEPLVAKPIAMCWDARGRLFVAETVDYPNERKDAGGRDRIKILADTDGDGRADRATVFAEGLSIPTSLVCANGGVIVAQAPDMLFLRDTDGDDRADERTVLFSGWGTGDTHAGPSNLRYGFDNRIWGAVGYSGFRGRVGGEQLRFGQGFYRFAPDGAPLEFLASTTNNTWGLGFSEEGDVLGSTANGNPSVHLAVPNRVYESVAGWSPGALQTIAESLLIHPITRAVRQVDFHGKFTAAAGHALYTARDFPQRYWNRAAFVSAPTGHLLHQFFLERDGTSFVARDGWNLVASDDEWTAPICAEVGPDGAVWFIDWYSYIVQHNPTPPGFETGRGNAYETALRDKVHGRIYRVVPESAALAAPRDLAAASPDELVAALSDPNLFWRLTAQRLLVERGASDVRGALLARVAEQQLDALGLAPGALHALWTLSGLDLLTQGGPDTDDALVAALRHPAPSVRRAAVELLPRVRWAREVLLSARLLDDPDPRVRLAVFTTLAEMERSEAAGAAVHAALERDGALADRWLRDAATAAAARHDAGFLKAVLANTRFEVGERQGPVNVLANPEMEGDGARPAGWAQRVYSGECDLARGPGRSGRGVRIESTTGSDTSWFQAVDVEPQTTYRLSGWIRTEGFSKGSGLGALFNVHEIQGDANARTPAITADGDWQRVEVEFDTGARNRVSINCLFGGWGRSTGVAFYDDVRLERLDAPLLGGELGKLVSRVAGHYAARGPGESIGSMVGALVDVPGDVAAVFLESFAARWPERGSEPDEAQVFALSDALGRLTGDAQLHLATLTRKLGYGDALFSREEVAVKLGAMLASDTLGAAERVAAAEQLVRLDDEPVVAQAILAHAALDADPALIGGLLRALGASRCAETGAEILARWEHLSPTAQREAVRVLLRRASWTLALLDAIERGDLPASLVDPDQWTRLSQHPEASIAARVAELRARSGDADAAALIERFSGALDLRGDLARGDALFTENCAKCHVLAGRGARVGPDLDGIGARPKAELLIEVLDPNRSVETNYQLWTVRSRDGQIHGGRLVAETRTTIELLEASGESLVLDRADLDLVQPSALSLMPSGFESLGAQGMADLLAYLAAQHD